MTNGQCKGICTHPESGYQAHKCHRIGRKNGLKWCCSCQVYLKYDEGTRCPCCNTPLRVKTRYKTARVLQVVPKRRNS